MITGDGLRPSFLKRLRICDNYGSENINILRLCILKQSNGHMSLFFFCSPISVCVKLLNHSREIFVYISYTHKCWTNIICHFCVIFFFPFFHCEVILFDYQCSMMKHQAQFNHILYVFFSHHCDFFLSWRWKGTRTIKIRIDFNALKLTVRFGILCVDYFLIEK